METFKLQCPIPEDYFDTWGYCVINQMFGEKRQFMSHAGVDFRTKWPLSIFNKKARQGLIPVLAACDGMLTWTKNDNRDIGISMGIRNGDYEVFYHHLDSLIRWHGDGKGKVKAGQEIAIAGNTGSVSSGAHLHFELRYKGAQVDPMPHFLDGVIYRYGSTPFTWDLYLDGKQINV